MPVESVLAITGWNPSMQSSFFSVISVTGRVYCNPKIVMVVYLLNTVNPCVQLDERDIFETWSVSSDVDCKYEAWCIDSYSLCKDVPC